MKRFLLDFATDTQGQDIVEYTLLVVLLAVVGIYWFTDSGNQLKGLWTSNQTLANAKALVR